MKDIVIIQVCSSDKGGGAENLVEKLVGSSGLSKESYGVFFSNSSSKEFELDENKFSFRQNPKSIINVFKLRGFLKRVKKTSDKKIIIHAHLTWPLFFVALASVGFKVELVYTEHSTHNKRRNYPFLKLIDLFAYSRYSKVIGVSKATSVSLLNWLGPRYKNKIITIENGAELFHFESRENIPFVRKLKLLSVGSLKHLKGFETTIKSLEAVKDIVGSYTIVGAGPDLEKLQKIAKESKVDDIVHFEGWTDKVEIFYKKADVLIIPSHWEGFGLVAVEGMSTGLPIIASNVSGLDEVVSDELLSSILIDNFKEPGEWSAAINVMKNRLETSAKEMSFSSRAQSEKFSLDKMLKSYEELYVELGQK